jgi:hypothetical protein
MGECKYWIITIHKNINSNRYKIWCHFSSIYRHLKHILAPLRIYYSVYKNNSGDFIYKIRVVYIFDEIIFLFIFFIIEYIGMSPKINKLIILIPENIINIY